MSLAHASSIFDSMSEVTQNVYFDFFRVKNIAGESKVLLNPLEVSHVNSVRSYSSSSHVANARERLPCDRPGLVCKCTVRIVRLPNIHYDYTSSMSPSTVIPAMQHVWSSPCSVPKTMPCHVQLPYRGVVLLLEVYLIQTPVRCSCI
jgi:hypothetical protein